MIDAAFSPTGRQLDALRFIRGYQMAHGGVSPCLRQICVGIGLSGKSGVFRLLRGLEDRGLIRRLPNRDRAIEVLVPVDVPRAPNGAPLYFVPPPSVRTAI